MVKVVIVWSTVIALIVFGNILYHMFNKDKR